MIGIHPERYNRLYSVRETLAQRQTPVIDRERLQSSPDIGEQTLETRLLILEHVSRRDVCGTNCQWLASDAYSLVKFVPSKAPRKPAPSPHFRR